MRTPRRLLAVLLVAAFALAGCGGEASPKPAPLTKTPTASTSSPPSALPSAVTGSSDQAAAAFVSYFLKVYSDATVSGKTEAFATLGTADCATCQRLKKTVDDTYAAGGKLIGRGARATDLTVRVAGGRQSAVVLTTVTVYPQTWVRKKGATPTQTKGGPAPSRFELVLDRGQWRVREWEFT